MRINVIKKKNNVFKLKDMVNNDCYFAIFQFFCYIKPNIILTLIKTVIYHNSMFAVIIINDPRANILACIGRPSHSYTYTLWRTFILVLHVTKCVLLIRCLPKDMAKHIIILFWRTSHIIIAIYAHINRTHENYIVLYSLNA